MKIYNKLVRDKIPEIIKADGGRSVLRTLSNIEYLDELVKKLREETAEFEADHSLEELADIYEVVLALNEVIGKTETELKQVRARKAKERGGFKKRLFLESVE